MVDDELARTAQSIREFNEALSRRQYGYPSVDAYYADASLDQRLCLITAPLLVMNAYDDPIVCPVSASSTPSRQPDKIRRCVCLCVYVCVCVCVCVVNEPN